MSESKLVGLENNFQISLSIKYIKSLLFEYTSYGGRFLCGLEFLYSYGQRGNA